MKIILISRGIPSEKNPQWGCFEKDQAEALVSYGHEVFVISVDSRFEYKRGKYGLHKCEINGAKYYNYITPPGIIFEKIFGENKYRLKYRNQLFQKIVNQIISEHGKPQIIYSHFFQNTIQGKLLEEKFDIPLVAIEHLARFNESKLDNFTYKWANFAYKNLNTIITVSDSLGKSLQKWYNIPSYKVIHNLYGAEFGKYIPQNKINEKFIFVSCASLVHRKGFDILIKALSKINIPKEKWILNIIGWGEEKVILENMIKANHLENNIFLLGKMNKKSVACQLSKSNAFILPSRNENFSVSILEALSMGLPIVSTDCGGIRNCIHSENGLIVPVEDIDSLTVALENIYTNYNKFDREKIHKDCVLKFSPKAIASQLTKIFEDTIDYYETKKKI